MKPINQCFACQSRRCYTRIHTDDFSFDEVACGAHSKDLYKHVDKILGRNNGVNRNHISSSSRLNRKPQ